jgi:hypothetical protein
MPENFPVLYRNIMDGLPSDLARDAFLWAVERPNEDRMCYRAEKFAREVHELLAAIEPLLTMAAQVYGQDAYDPDLMRFIQSRHANMRYDGNVSPPYARAA